MIVMAGAAEIQEKRIRVLIIEDSLGYARFVYELLKIDDPYGFEIFHNVKLESGLERTLKNDIDIILLDLGLPDSTGLDTLVKVLEYNNQIPIVIFSNRSDEEFIQKAIKLGAQDYLCKGEFDSHLLRHTLKAAIERKKLLSQLELQSEEISTKNTTLQLNERRYMQMVNHLPGLFMVFDSQCKIRLIHDNLISPKHIPVNDAGIEFLQTDWNSLLEKVQECICKAKPFFSEETILFGVEEYTGNFSFIPVRDDFDNIHEVIVSTFNLQKK